MHKFYKVANIHAEEGNTFQDDSEITNDMVKALYSDKFSDHPVTVTPKLKHQLTSFLAWKLFAETSFEKINMLVLKCGAWSNERQREELEFHHQHNIDSTHMWLGSLYCMLILFPMYPDFFNQFQA